MNTPPKYNVTAIWNAISKEITGIQLLWEAVEGIYLKQPQLDGFACLDLHAPMLFRLMQTSMMESLLMRVSRLMDRPKTAGNSNLSFEQFQIASPEMALDVAAVYKVWKESKLKIVRDKYLSHNDLDRSLTEAHTLNISLSGADVEAIRELTAALRELRRIVSQKMSGAAYLDETLNVQIRKDIHAFSSDLAAADCFYKMMATPGF